MNIQAVLYPLIVIVAFGVYPLLLKIPSIPMYWLNITLMMSATLTVIIPTILLEEVQKMPNIKAFSIVTLAGVLMGLGLLFFAKILQNQSLDISIIVPIIAGATTLITFLGGVIFLGEVISVMKILGLILILIGIVIINH